MIRTAVADSVMYIAGERERDHSGADGQSTNVWMEGFRHTKGAAEVDFKKQRLWMGSVR
jgi:hypothetical protein